MWTSNVSSQQRRLVPPWVALGKVLPEGWGRGSFPSAQHWWGHTWSTLSSSGLPSTREPWTYWRQSSEGQWRWLRDWNISPMKNDWESWDCSAWRREGSGGILAMYTNTWSEAAKKMEPGSFQWQDNRQWAQIKTQEVPCEHQEALFYCEGDWAPA